jgi:hypothetical protein
MNFKSILVLGLTAATLGLSLPARAGDTANTVDSNQQVVVTGDSNDTRQNNKTKIDNYQSGRRSLGATGSAVTNSQGADIQGYDNKTRQDNKAIVNNTTRRTPR